MASLNSCIEIRHCFCYDTLECKFLEIWSHGKVISNCLTRLTLKLRVPSYTGKCLCLGISTDPYILET